MPPSTSGSTLLEGDVLHIGFHRVGKAPYPEDIVVPGVLRAIAQHLGLDLQTQGVFWGDYCYFAGVTGEAFRFLELMGLAASAIDGPMVQRYGNMSVARMYEHGFDAAGLEADLHLRPDLPDRASLQRAILRSLRDGKTPVIGIGVFGPHICTPADRAFSLTQFAAKLFRPETA